MSQLRYKVGEAGSMQASTVTCPATSTPPSGTPSSDTRASPRRQVSGRVSRCDRLRVVVAVCTPPIACLRAIPTLDGAGVRVHVTAVGLRDHPHAEWVLARAVRSAEVAASQSRPAWGPTCGGGCYCGVCRREQPHSCPSTLSSCRRCVRRVLSRMSPPRVLQPTLLLPVTWALAAARSPMPTQSSRTKFWKPG